MIKEGYITVKGLSEKYNVSVRTIHNRLASFRFEHPEALLVARLDNGRPMFLYKEDCLSEEMITKRHYTKRKKGHTIEYISPPVTITGDDGKEYNLTGLKALLLLLRNTTLLEKFMALNVAFWCGLILYFWRM